LKSVFSVTHHVTIVCILAGYHVAHVQQIWPVTNHCDVPKSIC